MFRTKTGFNGNMAAWPIAALRIYTGLFFLIHGFGKLQSGSGFADGMEGFLKSQENTFGFYQGIVESFIIPNKALFGWLVAGGEFFLGIALVLGLMTRYAGFLGAFMLMNFWFAKGQGFWAGQNHDVIWMIILLVLALVPAGQAMGLDGKLSGRLNWLK